MAIKCPECNKTGDKRKDQLIRESCPKCDYDLAFKFIYGVSRGYFKCDDCKGTGKFKQRLGRVVDCYKCNGKGVIKCNRCNGKGYINERQVKSYCFKCKGTGSIISNPFNPVIPKGAVL